MTHTRDGLQLIYQASEKFTRELYPDLVLKREPTTPLIGSQAVLDSIGLIDFLAMVEDHVLEKTGASIRILSDKAMSQSQSPLKDFASLSSYVDGLIRSEA